MARKVIWRRTEHASQTQVVYLDTGSRPKKQRITCDGTCQSRSSPGQRGDEGVSQWPAGGTRARRGWMQRRACKAGSRRRKIIMMMRRRKMELNVLWMTYVLWRGIVRWRCMVLLVITVHKHVYTTTTCCSIATNQRRDPRRVWTNSHDRRPRRPGNATIATDEMKVSDLLSSDDSVLSNLCPHSGPGTCKIGPILTVRIEIFMVKTRCKVRLVPIPMISRW